MTQTFCELEQVSLVNIISLSEARLQRNFEVILKALSSANERFGVLETRITHNEKCSQASIDDLNKRLELADLSMQRAAVQQAALTKGFESVEIGLRQQRNELQQKLKEVESHCEQSLVMLEKEAARTKEQLILLHTEEKKLMDVISLRHEKGQNEMEKVRKEISSLVMKSEHIAKKVKSQEEKLEKVEIEASNTANNTQRAAEDLAVRLLTQLNSGGLQESSAAQPGAQNISPQQGSTRALKEGASNRESTKQRTSGGVSFPNILKHNIQTRFGDDPQGLARSVSELRERMQIQESNINKNMNKFSETFTKQLAEIRTLKAELGKETREKAQLNSSYLLEKIQQIRPELNRLSSRIDTADDRDNFIERRLEEARRTIGQLTSFAKENSMTRFDEKLRQTQTEFFSQLRELSTKVDLKTNNTDFVKSSQAFQERFRQIIEFLSTKCEKLEVKKALLFIESKIKEIILVISEDEEHEKDALLTKKNIKCISCDKELDRYSGLVNSQSRNWNQLPSKQLQSQHLGKFGITKFGSLAKKLKRLESNELPMLRQRKDE